MLRIAVISLLLANLLLLGFQGSKPAVQPETIVKHTVVEDSGIPTIHLYSEMVQDQDLMSGSRRCFSLGPFHSVEDKNETRALLEEVSANISERETQALVEKGYWVFMPPYESLLKANQMLLSLQALGLKDVAVIYNGDWKNAVSLGYFLRQENALRRKKGLEDRGFAPKVRVQRQSESRYWLDIEQSPGSGLITMDMQERPNDFMQRSLPCPDQNPFEITAAVSENPAVETQQPQTQLPEEETLSPPEEINEPQLKEDNEPQPEEFSEPQSDEDESLQLEDGGGLPPTEEIDLDAEVSIDTTPVDYIEPEVTEPVSEPQPDEGESLQLEDGGGSPPTEEVDLDAEVSIDTTPVDYIEPEAAEPEIAEPEATEPEATEPEIKIEQEASETLADDTLENQVEIPEAGGESQSIDDGVDLEGVIDSIPVDDEKVVPESAAETEPESSAGTDLTVETEPESSAGTDLTVETEPENSVGTGPVISFGTGLEDGDETELEGSDTTEQEDGNGTEPGGG